MKVLLIGNGAREHAIAEAFNRNKNAKLFSYLKSKNPGIISLSGGFEIGNYNDLEKIKSYAQKIKPDFAFIGPEDPLNNGVVDLLKSIGISSVGPTKNLAQLETSKSFTRNILKKYKIKGNAKFEFFDKNNIKDVKKFIDSIGKCVVKPDGLTGGKGVKVQGDHFQTKKEALDYCSEVLQSHSSVIVEEKFKGEEFSLQCLTDGKAVVATPPVQDHKRAYADDKGPNCYSEDTEILTEKGWKTFDKLNRDDKVMTYNPSNKILKVEKPLRVYWMKYKGRMLHFKHRELDLLVTLNHRMLIKNRKTKKEKILDAQKLSGECNLYLSGIWKGKSLKVYRIKEFDYKFGRKLKKYNINFSDWVKFMGLFLSEGYIFDNKKEHRVFICQSPTSRHFEEFKKILSKLPFKFFYSPKDYKFRINSIQLCKVLSEYGLSHEKFVPNYIKNANRKNIEEFLDAFLMGDGSIHNGRKRFHSGSKRLIDDIQELVMKLRRSSIITLDKRKTMLNPINKKYYKANPVYSLEIKPENEVGIRKKDIKKIDYIGYIGCVTVSTGFVVVRRNNRVAISGNTGGMGSYSCENHLLPFLTKKYVEEGLEITQKVAEALHKETGEYYRGVMYAGFIVTKEGIKLLEYNARFGDPETMNILPIMETDFVDVCEAIINQNLNKIKIKFQNKATVCKYVVPEGYPDNPVKNEKISVGKIPKDARLYYASVDQKDDGLYLTSSRAIGCLGIADSLEEAERIAEEATKSVRGKVFHREDIGTKKLIEKRIRHMKEILSK